MIATFIWCYLAESTRDVQSSRPNLVQHYPKLPELLDANSNSKMMVCSPRPIISSPAVPQVARYEKLARKVIPLAQHSSSFVATQIELPVVDITCNYNSCRYQTFEDTLRSQYGENYPPGEVVMNYIQLSTPDSLVGIEQKDNLLDPFEEGDSSMYSVSVSTKLEAEYMSLLDHFILKQREKALTESKFTEIPSSDEKNPEIPSPPTAASNQSTLKSSLTQEKESGSANQRSSKDTECARFR